MALFCSTAALFMGVSTDSRQTIALDALPNSGAVATGPQLVKAVGSAALNTVRLFFSPPLGPASVQPSRFGVFGNNAALNVSAVTLNADDPRQVVLTTAAQTQGTEYTVTVNNVTDTSGNTIAPIPP